MKIKALFRRIIIPYSTQNLFSDFLLAVPRILGGLILTLDFGSSKFGMPWTSSEQELALFEVAAWFPEDVAKFGFPFSSAPWLFAWLGAASEAIGGVFLVLGLGTRFWSFLLVCTMLTAIFLQKWPQFVEQGSWAILPALGFLWIALYSLVLGSGKWGLDYLWSKQWRNA